MADESTDIARGLAQRFWTRALKEERRLAAIRAVQEIALLERCSNDELKRKAHNGDSMSQFVLGRRFFNETDPRPQDTESKRLEGLVLIAQAAHAGLDPAKLFLAIYYNGEAAERYAFPRWVQEEARCWQTRHGRLDQLAPSLEMPLPSGPKSRSKEVYVTGALFKRAPNG